MPIIESYKLPYKMQWPSKKETKGNRYEKNYSSKYQPLPRLENRLKTRKSQDQWDRYLNGVEDNAIRERGEGVRDIFAWQGVENSR